MDRGDNGSGKGGGGFKLFGVNINLQDDLYNTSSESTSKKKRIHKDEDVECIRNNRSMGNLNELCNRGQQHHGIAHDDCGYHSDELHLNSGRPACVRKKAIPWTPSEHKCFLIGLEKLGKGDWKGISKNYVPTKTPAQVASHAQKYFIRITAAETKNRRSNLLDIPFKESNSPPHASTGSSSNTSKGSQQVMTADVNPLKKASENHGLDGLSANSAANEKKPQLPPVTRANASDARHISYITGVQGQSYPAAHVTQQTELHLMLNGKYPSYHHDSSSHANFPAQGLSHHPHSITPGTSLALPATTVAENSAVVHHYESVSDCKRSSY